MLSLLARYGAVGLFNTAVTAVLMVVLAYVGIHYAIYTAIGYAVGFVCSYVLNAKVTFKANATMPGLGLFVLINGALLLLVEALQYALIERAGSPEFYAVALGMVVYAGLGFVLNKSVVYR